MSFSFLGENGHFYCGMRVLTCPCCDGICGPQSGCNCSPCQKLDKEEEGRRIRNGNPIIISSMIHQSWTWGRKPSKGLDWIGFGIWRWRNVNLT